MKRSTLLRIVGILLLGVAILLAVMVVPVKQQLSSFVEWGPGLGMWAPVVFGAAYIPACILFVPGSILTLAAGFAFGVVRGTLTAWLGSLFGASAAFLLGRTLARGLIEERLARYPRFRAIDQAVAEHGFRIVLLMRLSPVLPFNVLDYAFGVTRVRFRDHFLASAIGMLPGTVMYAYVGSAIKQLGDLTSGRVESGTPQKVFFFAGLAATVVVTVYVTRIARQALARVVPPHGPTGNAS